MISISAVADGNPSAMEHPPDEEIHCVADDLLVFIDDTGHESFAGDQEYYGLGHKLIKGIPSRIEM
jgi:hypothetical protein